MPSKNLTEAEFYKGYFREIFAGIIQADEGGIKEPGQVFTEPGVETYLKEELKTVVSSINSLRKFCLACEKSDDVKSLICCENCHSAYYCSAICKTSKASKHAKVCHHMRSERFDQIVEMLPPICNLSWLLAKGRKIQAQAKEIASWEDWLLKAHEEMAAEIRMAAPKVCQWYELTGWTPTPTPEELERASLNVLTNLLTTTMTIAGSLIDFKVDPRQQPVVIHLPGAAGMEACLKTQNLVSELSALFPGHKSLELVLIGPEVTGDFYPPLSPADDTEEDRDKQTVTFSKFNGLYDTFMQNYVAEERAYPPDVVVAFHPGLSAVSLQKSWLSSIKLMVTLNLPTILTCYNLDEYEETMKYLNSEIVGLNINFIKTGVNAFGSRLIKQTAHSLDEVFAPNMYTISFQGLK